MPLALRAGRFPGGRRPPGNHPRGVVLALAVAALAAIAATAGCAGERPAQAVPPEAVLVLPDDGRLTALHALPPINGYLSTANPVDRRITVAEQRLTVDCMARQGLRYQPIAPPADAAADSAPMPFGLETLPTTAGDARETPAPEEQSERFGRALLGDDAHRITVRGRRTTVTRSGNGCIAEAQQRLLGDGRPRWVQVLVLLYEAQEDARAQLDGDRGFRDANARWSACMRRHGMAYPHPMALFDDLSGVANLAADPRVRRDLACKAETGYLAAAYERLAAVQRQVLDRDPSVVRDWTALRNHQSAVARTVPVR